MGTVREFLNADTSRRLEILEKKEQIKKKKDKFVKTQVYGDQSLNFYQKSDLSIDGFYGPNKQAHVSEKKQFQVKYYSNTIPKTDRFRSVEDQRIDTESTRLNTDPNNQENNAEIDHNINTTYGPISNFSLKKNTRKDFSLQYLLPDYILSKSQLKEEEKIRIS